MDELVQVSEVCVNFGKNVVLNNVSAVFLRGKAYGIIGNNGTGKTVLMKCISGFIIPDKGLISVNGRIVGKDIDFPPNIGILIETPGFLPGLSGYGNLRLLAGIRNLIDDKEIREAIANHTFASPHLCDLGKILFAADKIEPGRPQSTDEYRANLFAKPLNELTLSVLQENIDYLESRGKIVAAVSYTFRDELLQLTGGLKK